MTAFQNAAWIWRNAPAGTDEFCDFLTTFHSAPEQTCRLRIAADSNYTVWLNGKLAAFGQYADYPDYKVYDDIDMTELVTLGENRLVVTVWYYGIDTQTYICGEAGLIFELTDGAGQVLAASGAETLSRLSRDYISGKNDLISGQLGQTYHYDMTGDDGFRTDGQDGFAPSRIVEGISTDFHLRPNKKLTLEPRRMAKVCLFGQFRYMETGTNPASQMQTAALTYRAPGEMGATDFSSPATLKMNGEKDFFDGLYFTVDLGAETAGFLDLDIEVPAGCRMDVGFGEHLADGRLRTAIRGFWCDIELKAGRNQYLHTFRRFGCRYLQFFIHSTEAVVHYAGLRETRYPLRAKDYRCGNLLRETIYRVCQNTLQQCLHEHYEDCPWREQALYTMDSRNQMLCGYYAFGEVEAPRAALELISHGVRPDGLLTLCYPAGKDFPIPAFSCMYFVQMDEYIRHSGDTTLAREKLPMLERLMSVFLSKRQENGILENFYGAHHEGGKPDYWNFYEWTPTMSGSFGEMNRRLEAPLNAFVSLALQALGHICEALGETDRAAAYRAESRALNAAIAAFFFNPSTRLFESFDAIHRGEYAVLTQALCLLCGAADGLDQSVILRVLASNGAADTGLCVYPNTLSMNAFRFDALLALDRDKYAPLILSELDRDYLYMLREGATSFWETIVGAADFGGAGSLCHGWSALPVYYYEILQ